MSVLNAVGQKLGESMQKNRPNVKFFSSRWRLKAFGVLPSGGLIAMKTRIRLRQVASQVAVGFVLSLCR